MLALANSVFSDFDGSKTLQVLHDENLDRSLQKDRRSFESLKSMKDKTYKQKF